jgi:ABC-2 type transport system ATP-binding protein
MDGAPALEILNLEKTYDSGTKALSGVSLTVPQGDFFALLGPNGAGKTTIIGIITSLVKKTGGSVKVYGHDIDRELEKAKTYIGLVGQDSGKQCFRRSLPVRTEQALGTDCLMLSAAPQTGIWEKKNRHRFLMSVLPG